MSTVFFSGELNGSPLGVTMPLENVKTMLGFVLEGRDDVFDSILETMLPDTARVINAMSFESETFINMMFTLLDGGGRFAINHGSLKFGVSTDESESVKAFVNEEF